MSAKEKETDRAVRQAIVDSLMPSGTAGGPLPVLALIEIVVRYTLPFRGVVTTVLGSRADGTFDGLRGVCFTRGAGGSALLIADSNNARFMKYSFESNQLAVLISSRADHAFYDPMTVCIDPINANRFYLLDHITVRRLDVSNAAATAGGRGSVTLIAGCKYAGMVDGPIADTRFNGMYDGVCTRDGRTLYVCDMRNNRMRTIDMHAGVVSTLAGSGSGENIPGPGDKAALLRPEGVTFDRTPGVKPESGLFVGTEGAIMRIELTAAGTDVRLIKFDPLHRLSPLRVVSLSGGQLLVTCRQTNRIYAVDPLTGDVRRVAGCGPANTSPIGCRDGSALLQAEFHGPTGLSVDEDERCVYVADRHNNSIRKVTLAPFLFGA